MPWPYTGLKAHAVSPTASKRSGQRRNRSKWRRRLAVLAKPTIGVSGSASRIVS